MNALITFLQAFNEARQAWIGIWEKGLDPYSLDFDQCRQDDKNQGFFFQTA